MRLKKKKRFVFIRQDCASTDCQSLPEKWYYRGSFCENIECGRMSCVMGLLLNVDHLPALWIGQGHTKMTFKLTGDPHQGHHTMNTYVWPLSPDSMASVNTNVPYLGTAHFANMAWLEEVC